MSDKDIMQELKDATHVTPDLLRRMVMAGGGRSSGGHTKAINDRLNALEDRFVALDDRLTAMYARVAALEANIITPKEPEAPSEPEVSEEPEHPHKKKSHH